MFVSRRSAGPIAPPRAAQAAPWQGGDGRGWSKRAQSARSRQRQSLRQQRGRGSCARRFPRATAKAEPYVEARRAWSIAWSAVPAGWSRSMGRDDVAVSPLARPSRGRGVHRLPIITHQAGCATRRSLVVLMLSFSCFRCRAVPRSHPCVGTSPPVYGARRSRFTPSKAGRNSPTARPCRPSRVVLCVVFIILIARCTRRTTGWIVSVCFVVVHGYAMAVPICRRRGRTAATTFATRRTPVHHA